MMLNTNKDLDLILSNPEYIDKKPQTHLVFEQAYSLRPMNPTEFVLFMHKVTVNGTGECWTWTGKAHRHNYGIISQDGKNAWVHRLSYTHFKGPIPRGLVVDHICENKRCVNPDHLKVVTLSQNNQLYHWRRRDRHNMRLPF
jgi:hypothetical protein